MDLLRRLVTFEFERFQKIMFGNTKKHLYGNIDMVYFYIKIKDYILLNEINEEVYVMKNLICPTPLLFIYEWYKDNLNYNLARDNEIKKLLCDYAYIKEINQ